MQSKQDMENHAKKHAQDVEAKKRMKRMYNSQKYAIYVYTLSGNALGH